MYITMVTLCLSCWNPPDCIQEKTQVQYYMWHFKHQVAYKKHTFIVTLSKIHMLFSQPQPLNAQFVVQAQSMTTEEKF